TRVFQPDTIVVSYDRQHRQPGSQPKAAPATVVGAAFPYPLDRFAPISASQLLRPLTPRCTAAIHPSHTMSTAIRLIQMSNFRPRPSGETLDPAATARSTPDRNSEALEADRDRGRRRTVAQQPMQRRG